MNKKIALILIIIIVIAGIVMGCIKGFNYGLTYEQNERIKVALDRRISKGEISEIAKKVFEGQKVRVQTVEIFEDTALITVQSTNDEQIDKLVQAINEKYSLEYTKNDINITKVTGVSIFDMAKNYIIPVLIIVLITVAYMSVRYRKLKMLKVVLTLIVNIVLTEAILVSVYLIARISVNEFTMPIALAVLGFTLFTTSFTFEKGLSKLNVEEI